MTTQQIAENVQQAAKGAAHVATNIADVNKSASEIGSALPTKEKMEYKVRGRDLVTGLPKDITITSNEIAEAFRGSSVEIHHFGPLKQPY